MEGGQIGPENHYATGTEGSRSDSQPGTPLSSSMQGLNSGLNKSKLPVVSKGKVKKPSNDPMRNRLVKRFPIDLNSPIECPNNNKQLGVLGDALDQELVHAHRIRTRMTPDSVFRAQHYYVSKDVATEETKVLDEGADCTGEMLDKFAQLQDGLEQLSAKYQVPQEEVVRLLQESSGEYDRVERFLEANHKVAWTTDEDSMLKLLLSSKTRRQILDRIDLLAHGTPEPAPTPNTLTP